MAHKAGATTPNVIGLLSAHSVAVVSPHLDDAALSLGATITRLVWEGADVRVVTVFGGNPDSSVESGNWDRRGGYQSLGAAARGRRSEDLEAWRLLGARPLWLPFGDAQYAGERVASDVWGRIAEAVTGAELVLVPGFPLAHPDHAWLANLLVANRLPVSRTGLYVEQPYAYWVRGEYPHLGLASALEPLLETAPEWRRAGRLPLRAVLQKRRAIHAYRSQLPLLGLTQRHGRVLTRILAFEMRHGGEAIALLDQ